MKDDHRERNIARLVRTRADSEIGSFESLAELLSTTTLPIEVGDGRFLDVLDKGAIRAASLEDRAAAARAVCRALDILRAAEEYETEHVTFKGAPLPVHNAELVPFIRERYTADDLRDVFTYLHERGVFASSVDPRTGLVRTSETDENPAMGARQWLTDSVGCGFWQRVEDPNGWKRSMIVNAQFVNGREAREAIERTCRNPGWARERDASGAFREMNGVPHIFLPAGVRFEGDSPVPVRDEIRSDEAWSNQKRLESQALLLVSLGRTITYTIDRGVPWGFTAEELSDPAVVEVLAESFAGLTAYLVNVNRDPARPDTFDFAAPSAGSWEERSYDGGMAFDTAITVSGLKEFSVVMTNPSPALDPLRAAIRSSTFAKYLPSENELARCIEAGHRRVVSFTADRLRRGEDAVQAAERSSDTSLCFISSFHYHLDADPAESARIHLRILDQLERDLLRDNGMIRYAPHTIRHEGEDITLVDSYLGAGYWLPESIRAAVLGRPVTAREGFGSSDASSVQTLLLRQQSLPPGTEAQWVLGPGAILQGLAWLLQETASSDDLELRERIKVKIGEYVTRNLAMVSGSAPDGRRWLKANGHECAPFRVMEAYEFVPTLTRGRFAVLPGAHPLAWGSAQLFDGLRKAEISLRAAE